MLSISWNEAARHALPLFFSRLPVLPLPGEDSTFHRDIRHLPGRPRGKSAPESVRVDCPYRDDLRVSLACVCPSLWALRQERGFLLWHLHLRIPGAAGDGSSPHPGEGIRPLFCFLAPSDSGFGIPELSLDRSSLLKIENGEDVLVPASRRIVRRSAD